MKRGLTMNYSASAFQHVRAVDYSTWSFEELREFAVQLRLSGAECKSRRELLDFFVESQVGHFLARASA
jgi:hypothetical protein